MIYYSDILNKHFDEDELRDLVDDGKLDYGTTIYETTEAYFKFDFYDVFLDSIQNEIEFDCGCLPFVKDLNEIQIQIDNYIKKANLKIYTDVFGGVKVRDIL